MSDYKCSQKGMVDFDKCNGSSLKRATALEITNPNLTSLNLNLYSLRTLVFQTAFDINDNQEDTEIICKRKMVEGIQFKTIYWIYQNMNYRYEIMLDYSSKGKLLFTLKSSDEYGEVEESISFSK